MGICKPVDELGLGLLLLAPILTLMVLLFHPQKKRYRRLFGFFILLVAILEGGLRWYAGHHLSLSKAQPFLLPDNEPKYSERLHEAHPYVLYIPKSNLSLASGLHHNRFGFRDSRSLKSKGNAIRVVFIGGSTTYNATIWDNNKINQSSVIGKK